MAIKKKIAFYLSKQKREEFKNLMGSFDKLIIRRFIEEFKNIQVNQAETFGKELEKKMESEIYTIGCGKAAKDINDFLKKEV